MDKESLQDILKESEATWQAIVEHCRQLRASGQPNFQLEQFVENRNQWLGFSNYAKTYGMTFDEVKQIFQEGKFKEEYIQYSPIDVKGKKFEFWRIRNLPLEQLLKK
ncbi:hypothetical protein [Runella slithyformis]|uniref:Uncharacterized protein n=1 Tax=Runella slithyformis (strain ATCC 29530 / DSM 19594 / LMG 11500 / NCIMB 11436 / LSU 4) TaxID=761193 RepID=A0A7U3ZH98_RUNSL|nr:hypothetical protein [Runella slithyformis]AEI47140.1 hypothetical protein Runsl_0698 [Runella slithyformis DSM 19594]